MSKENLKKEAFADDQLGRKSIAENFKSILLNTDSNVFSLVAPWGCGKTYFINNLIKIMEEDSINILYNAWESDFYDSPLIPLLSELFIRLETLENKDKLKKDITWSKKFAKKICKSTTIQAGINVKAFNCNLNFDPAKKMIDSEYIELKNEILEFKTKLKKIQQTLNKKIIIFIDELDRCNPIYTIKTLEVIKHFFGIPNIIFVLAVDKTQIENSVRTIFGVNIGEENGYLRKFIDVEFNLPETQTDLFVKHRIKDIWIKIEKFLDSEHYYNFHLQRKVDAFGFERGMAEEKEQNYLTNMICKIAELLNLSLRDLEKFFVRLDLSLDIHSDSDLLLVEPCIIFNLLLIKDFKLFDEYIKNQGEVAHKIDVIVPGWNGLFADLFRRIIGNPGGTFADELKEKVENLRLLIGKFTQVEIAESLKQERYLQSYPLKIKFINNFNILQ